MSSQACVACGAANPPGALYCGRCGAPQGRPCPSCGAVVGLEAAFCTTCGAAVEPAPTPPAAEERKIVSVLFADLVGFTGRAERLDPEDVRGLLSPYHARMRAELERFSGTVEKFIGDAVVALFGAPVAHEDDPERAVRAALAARDAIAELNAVDPSLALQVRIGITTGEALVTRDARPSEGEGMAAGDVVNTAARLQAAAPVDGILVDEATFRATEQAIEYRERDAITAKGKANEVAAWEVVAPRARLGVDIAFRGGAALVGREEELDTLRDGLARVAHERTAQLITLVGVPGIGKSRLIYELWAALEADADLYAHWRQGRSLPYGDGVSFWALGEMAKAHAGILESDDSETAGAKLGEAVRHAVSDPAEAGWIESHLRPLVGLSGEPGREDRRTESFAAWRRFFESLAEQRPVVLVFEDLHWADDGLLDFVDYLVEWAGDIPLLVVCTARPELLERRPDWGGGKRNAATISLSPLSDEHTVRLLEALIGEPDRELVVQSGGNPLYAEEYARMLAQGADDGELPLPDSVHGIIAARLDTLPQEEKALVQDAAVLGKVFWIGELAHVAGLDPDAVVERVHALERKEFIRRERRSSVAGEAAYVFRHVLVRDVAYGQIPRPRRAEKHRLAAEWIDSLAGDRREDLADVVAHHYVSALELTRELGGDSGVLSERARLALRDAGDRAARLNAFGEAARFYRGALALWPEGDPEHPHLLFALGKTLFRSEAAGAEILTEAAEALLDAGDYETVAEAQLLIGELAVHAGKREEGAAHAVGAVALLDDRPPTPSKAYVLANYARFRMATEANEEAIRIGTEARRMAEELGLEELTAHTLATIGVARASIGDLGGIADLERSVELAEALNSIEVVRAYNNLASTIVNLGDLPRAYELYDRGRRAAERFGHAIFLRFYAAQQLDEAYWRGRWDEAIERADEFLTESGELLAGDARVIRARVRLARGDLYGALADSAAVARPEGRTDLQFTFPGLALRARVLVAAADLRGAGDFVDSAFDLWRTLGFGLPGDGLAELAVALEALGRGDELSAAAARATETRWLEAALAFASGDFASAARVYARIGSLPDEAYARLRAAETLVAAGRRDEADAELAPALEFYRRVGAEPFLRDGEALLAAFS